MRKIVKILVVGLLICRFLSPLSALCQITIDVPNPSYKTYEDIKRFNIINGISEPLTAIIKIELSDMHDNHLFTITVREAVLASGVNSFQSYVRKAVLNFYNNPGASYLKLNDQLADGDYKVCYSVITQKAGVAPANRCEMFTVHKTTPLVLVYPADMSEVCEERPVFQWQNPAPLPADARIKLLVAVIQPGQNETEAVNRNIPLINLSDVKANSVQLPSYIENLAEGNSYAWQVIIYNANGIIKKSEIWRFSKKCGNEVKQKQDADAFRQLKNSFDGNYYVVRKAIRFSFINSYATEKLDYSIVDIETGEKIRYYPEVSITSGMNNIEIDVNDCRGLKKGRIYVLKAVNIHSTVLQMRFKYER